VKILSQNQAVLHGEQPLQCAHDFRKSQIVKEAGRQSASPAKTGVVATTWQIPSSPHEAKVMDTASHRLHKGLGAARRSPSMALSRSGDKLGGKVSSFAGGYSCSDQAIHQELAIALSESHVGLLPLEEFADGKLVAHCTQRSEIEGQGNSAW